MIQDKYKLKSNIGADRKGSNQKNIRNFLLQFNTFYNGIRTHSRPTFVYDLKDPYGFALLCEDYQSTNTIYDMDLTCKDIFNGLGETEHMDVPTFHGQFTFREILDFLYIGFLFDYQKAINVYNNQHDAFSIFNQIINGNGFIYNRAKPNLKESLKASRLATESIIVLDENKPIKIPHVWRLCDGMVPPFIVQKHDRRLRVERGDCHGFGEGIFILNGSDRIVDCLKINDTWFVDLPLEHRLFFAFKCTEFEVERYTKAWSLRSILEGGRLLEANSHDGLLVRGAKESYFKNRWFNWSRSSLVYCKQVNGELVSKSAGNVQPKFYTLEGDEGLIDPVEERKFERVYLDNWDIREFQRILMLGE